MSPHLTEDVVATFVQGALSTEETARVEAHLESCAECLKLVGLAAKLGTSPKDTRYIVERRIGAGAMGTVFLAHDRELNRKVALKRVRGTATPERKERLRAEAQTMAQLNHPNVATVFDVGEDEQGLFVVMQWVEGGTARTWAEEKRRRWQDIVRLYIAAGEGLAAAHAANIVHRDFKPSNVLVAKDGAVQVTDFGLASNSPSAPNTWGAKDGAIHATLMTHSGALVGTPAYMSPEQHRGEAVGPESDQFSFCVALVEALTGERPFAGKSLAMIRAALERGPVFTPAFEQLPAGLKKTLRQGLSLAPSARFASMAKLNQQLRRAVEPAKNERLAVQLLLGVLLVAVAAAGTRAWLRRCVIDTERLDPLWNAQARDAVHTAFKRTSKPFVEKAFTVVDEAFTGFVNAWKAERANACAATRQRGEYSAEMLDRRNACLDHQLAQAESLARLLRNADEAAVLRATAAASSTLRLDACRDVNRLAAVPLEHATPWDAELAQVKALVALEKMGEALSFAQRVRVEAAGDQAALAQALWWEGKLLPDKEAGAAKLESAISTAATIGADETQAMAGLDLAAIRFQQGKKPEAEAALRQSLALFERIPQTAEMKYRRLSVQGLEALENGQHPTALEFIRQQVAVIENEPNPSPETLGGALINLGSTLARVGQVEESRAAFARGLSLLEQRLGPNHPRVGTALTYYAELELFAGAREDAIRLAQRAITIFEASTGETDVRLALPLYIFGQAMAGQGEPPEKVVPYFTRSRERLTASYGPHHPQIPVGLIELGTYWGAMRKLQQARAAFDEACQLRATKGAWLGECLSRYGLMLAQHKARREAMEKLEESLQILGKEGKSAFAAGDEALLMLEQLKALSTTTHNPLLAAEPAFARLMARGDTSSMDRARFQLSMASVLATRPSMSTTPRALELAEQSLAAFERLGATLETKRARALLSQLPRP